MKAPTQFIYALKRAVELRMNEQAVAAICNALRDPSVVKFVRKTIEQGYVECLTSEPTRARDLVARSFEVLEASQARGIDSAQLLEATRRLISDVFRKQDPSFWFNAGYQQYKTINKPEADFQRLQQWLPGQRVLDYGCGSGYLAARLARGGYGVFTTDVLDYRYNGALHLPFRAMQSPDDIAYPDDSADVAMVQAVLHHIDTSVLPRVLKKLQRIAKHMLIKEDTYGALSETEGVQDALKSQALMRRFVEFSREDQFKALVLIDYYANAVAQGVPEMHMPFAFRTPQEWKYVLEQNGFRVTRTFVVGFETGRMHKSCHVWMMCERG